MKTDKPIRKSFVCGGLLFAMVAILVAMTADVLTAYQFGYLFSGICLIPSLATAGWSWFSKQHWSWARFAITVIGFAVLSTLMQLSGQMPGQR